jgi:hypothetical protein
LVASALAAPRTLSAQQPSPTTAQKTSATPATAAPASAEKLPTPEHLLEVYIKAVGGADRLAKLSSRVMKGTVEVPAMNLTGTSEIYRAAPDRMFSLVHINDYGDFLLGFDGQVGWSSDPNVGFREFAGEELAQSRRDSQFQHELRFSEIYPQRRVLGKEKVGDREAWVLEATPKDADPENFYFDTETGLLLRHDAVQITPEGRVNVEQYYSDYMAVDGLRLPTTMRHIDPQTTWQVHFTEIAHNVPIEAAKFAKPAAQ